MDWRDYNRQAWDAQVAHGSPWTQPVSSDLVAAARAGDWQVLVTPTRFVPSTWFPPVADRSVLCLAGGGGQQGPILAAAGARVTVFDASERQLASDRMVAERDGLELHTLQGDMADLSGLADGHFDLVLNPTSTCFVDDVAPVWREVRRVLAPGGVLIAGFVNPMRYLFDPVAATTGHLHARFSLPYSDVASIGDDERQEYLDRRTPLEFSHTLETLLGGLGEAGLHITSLFEDRDSDPRDLVSRLTASYLAVRAVRP